jgi:hypothetical protein
MSSVEAEVGGESRVIINRSGLKKLDEALEVAREHCQDESAKSPLTRPTSSETGRGRSRAVEGLMRARSQRD